MTNYNERLDEVLANLVNQVAANEQRLLNGNATRKATIDSDSHATTQAKQAITSLIKELVADAKPEIPVAASWRQGIEKKAFEDAMRVYEYKLLKALEEV